MSGKEKKAREKKEKTIMQLGQQHAPRVLNVLLHLDQERDPLAAVEETVVVGKRKIHHLGRRQNHDHLWSENKTHRSDLDLAIDSDRPLLDSVQAQHRRLGQVNDRGTHQ